MTDNDTQELLASFAGHHYDVASYYYESNRTAIGDRHHAMARKACRRTDYDWEEIKDMTLKDYLESEEAKVGE